MDGSAASEGPETPTQAIDDIARHGRALDGAVLAFPVAFDLRIIYSLDGGASIVEDLERLYSGLGVPCSLIRGIAAPGAKYGRMGSRITLASREQMYAVYEAIGKLPYVKAAI